MAGAILNDSGFAELIRPVLPHDPMTAWFVARQCPFNGRTPMRRK